MPDDNDWFSDGFFDSPTTNLQDITSDQTMYVCFLSSLTALRRQLETLVTFWMFIHVSDQVRSSILRQRIQFQDYLAMSEYLTRWIHEYYTTYEVAYYSSLFGAVFVKRTIMDSWSLEHSHGLL